MTGRGTRSAALCAMGAAAALVLAGCDVGGSGTDGDRRTDGSPVRSGEAAPDTRVPTVTPPAESALLPGGPASARAAASSAAFFSTAPVVVLSSPEEQVRGASAGVALGVPVLVDGPEVAAELDRLGTEVVLAVGAVHDPGLDVVVPGDDTELARLAGIDAASPVPVPPTGLAAARAVAALDPGSPQLLVASADEASPGAVSPGDGASATGTSGTEGTGSSAGTDDATASSAPAPSGPTPAPAPLDSDRGELPATQPPPPVGGVAVVSSGIPEDVAAIATARAAGATVVVAPGGDPRATAEGVEALAAADAPTVLGLGEEVGDLETLQWRAETAATGVQLPGGGQLVLPDKTYVALYGTPSTGSLGVLGEQPPEQTVARAEEHAALFTDLTDEPVVPTLEIIVTVAAGEAGPDGNYSNELPVADIEPLVDLAEEHGLYVVLDLQPGRSDFLSQAQIYEDLLRRPHVGLALDPEWRLRPDQQPLQAIGQVDVAEVDQVATWLADLTREHDLPQKMFVLHQFSTHMIPGVDTVDRSRSELAVLLHADGQGAQGDKQATWAALHAVAPSMPFWGWKNFYDEDIPMLSPEETMTLVDPVPDLVTYQ